MLRIAHQSEGWPVASGAHSMVHPVARQRSDGRVNLSVGKVGQGTRIVRLAEAGPSRLRLMRGGGRLEAVLVNTGGGIACGDKFAVDVEAGPDSDLLLSTVAAEKAYRSDGPTADIAVRLSLQEGASLAWLPQETILYDRARLRRRFEADVSADARLVMFEAVVFGREAFGERMQEGLLEDRWRIRRDRRLVFADTLRLAGPVAALLARPAIAAGARALANFLYVAPDAEARLDEARAMLAECGCECGASAWNGLLAVRFLADTIGTLRRDAGLFLQAFRSAPLPRVWQS